MSAVSPVSRWRTVGVVVATVLGVGLTAAAGMWQQGRARTKQALHDAIVARQAMPSLDAPQLACDLAGWQQQVQRQALLRGRWLAHTQVWLDNRSMDGRAGFFLLQAFAPEASPGSVRPCPWRAVLVQRGWAPRDPTDRTRLPQVPTDDAPVRLKARLVEAPARVYELGQASASSAAAAESARGVPVRQNVSVAELSAQWGVALSPGTMLQLEPAQAAVEAGVALPTEPSVVADRGLLRHWWQPQADVGKHQAYALQWFAMAAVMLGLFLWFQVWRRWRPARTPAPLSTPP